MDELGYLNLLEKIMREGEERQDRTQTGTISLFGERLEFNLQGQIPLLTTKTVAWKSCIKELLWFLSGKTNAKELSDNGVHIWDGNTTRDFLDKRGLTELPEYDIGAGYGFQWRHFGASYRTCLDDYTGEGFDQIQYVLNEIQFNPTSRRIYMSAWNPPFLEKMALPPCHVSCQFYVSKSENPLLANYLSCHMYQRSVDCGLGLPFNIFSYSVLTYLLAIKCDLRPKRLIISMGDTHVYQTHRDALQTQLERSPYPFPTLVIDESIREKDWADITIDDFTLLNYQHHPTIKMEMSV